MQKKSSYYYVDCIENVIYLVVQVLYAFFSELCFR